MDILGQIISLKVKKLVDFGVYLEHGEEEILLPKRYVPENTKEEDELEVFIYKDSEDRIIATTLKPAATVCQCAFMVVKDITPIGAFLEWGIAKDLLLPNNEQKHEPTIGRKYLVYVFIDERTQRITASGKLGKFIKNEELTVNEKDEVELLVTDATELGFKVIINNRHWGLIYRNEVFTDLNPGDKRSGFVKKIREENKIDVSLQRQGYDEVDGAAQKIYELLKKHNNSLPLNDKTDPDTIYQWLAMSKKTFKRAAGLLFRQRKIEITEEGIKLIK